MTRQTKAPLHATALFSLGLRSGLVALPVLALILRPMLGAAPSGAPFGGMASVEEPGLPWLALPVAVAIGVALGVLLPRRTMALGWLGGLVGVTGLPIWVMLGISLGSAAGSAPHEGMQDRFSLDGLFSLPASGRILLLHLLCAALAALGVLAGCRMRTRYGARRAIARVAP